LGYEPVMSPKLQSRGPVRASTLIVPLSRACALRAKQWWPLAAKMETVLTRLRDTGHKIHAAKSLFCTHEIEYLGYILTREGIKTQPKRVQVILTLNPPNNVKELKHFLGMVQYYRDMWAKCRETLVPLTDLVGECGKTKTTKNNKTKKKPWRWDPIHQQAFDNVKAAITKEVVIEELCSRY
jgi:hypothetical protein